jgi:hypothetical protein
MFMTIGRLLPAAALIAGAILLTGCKIDAVAPMRAFDVKNTAQTGVPVLVTATITAAFASKDWCQDEGAMAIGELATPGVGMQATGCAQGNGGFDSAAGQFQVSTNLVKTAGAANPQVAVAEVLNQDLVRFAVFPHAKYHHLLSVGIFLNVPKFQAAQAKLLAMPVFKRGEDTANIAYTLSVQVTNDLPTMQKFYLNNVSADIDPSYAESVLQLPPGATETITLDANAEAKLMQQGYVNFFALDAE